MENSIPSLIIGAILLVASTLMARTSLQSYEQIGGSFLEMQTRILAQSQARLSITSATLNSGGDRLTVDLRNDGQTRVAAYDRVDVIIRYYTGPASLANTWMAYIAAAPVAGEWTMLSITNDAFEPGILNPNETAQIEIVLGPAAASGQVHTISITTESGATAVASFTS